MTSDKAMKFILKSNIFVIKLEMSAITKYFWSSLAEKGPSLVPKFHLKVLLFALFQCWQGKQMNLEDKNYILYLITVSLSDTVSCIKLIIDAGEENNWKYKIYFLKNASFFFILIGLILFLFIISIFTFLTPLNSNFIKSMYSLHPFDFHLCSEKNNF